MHEVLGEIRIEKLSVVSELWGLMPGSCCDSQISSTYSRGHKQQVPPVPRRPAPCLPHPPIPVVFHNFPGPRVTRAEKTPPSRT